MADNENGGETDITDLILDAHGDFRRRFVELWDWRASGDTGALAAAWQPLANLLEVGGGPCVQEMGRSADTPNLASEAYVTTLTTSPVWRGVPLTGASYYLNSSSCVRGVSPRRLGAAEPRFWVKFRVVGRWWRSCG